MAYVLIASTLKRSPDNAGVTSDALDTTGANLLVLSASWSNHAGVSNIAIEDSKGNTWTALTKYSVNVDNGSHTRLYYSLNPTVGTGHTFSAGLLQADHGPVLGVLAFSGAGAFESETGDTTTTATTLQPGTVTPAAPGALIVTGIVCSGDPPDGNFGGAISINSGFTAQSAATIPHENVGGGIAYLAQGAAASVTPEWDVTSIADRIASGIAVFSAGAVAEPDFGSNQAIAGQSIGVTWVEVRNWHLQPLGPWTLST